MSKSSRLRALLLAAGVGSRLRPLTAEKPKCLVSIAGKPVLERNIEWLRGQGINEMIINLHHGADQVREFCGDGSRFGVNIEYSPEQELLGTAGALRQARRSLGAGTFLLVYADNLFEMDLWRLFRVHERLAAVVTVALYRRKDPRSSGLVIVDADAKVQAFVEKPARAMPGPHWVNAGVLVCEPEVVDLVPDPPSDVGRHLIPALLGTGRTVAGYKMGSREKLYWIDTPMDLRRTEAAFARRPQ